MQTVMGTLHCHFLRSLKEPLHIGSCLFLHSQIRFRCSFFLWFIHLNTMLSFLLCFSCLFLTSPILLDLHNDETEGRKYGSFVGEDTWAQRLSVEGVEEAHRGHRTKLGTWTWTCLVLTAYAMCSFFLSCCFLSHADQIVASYLENSLAMYK